MNIEELKSHSNKPVWRYLRRIYQATNCLIVLILTALTLVIILFSPTCDKIQEFEWYENSLIYNIDIEQLKLNCKNDYECSFESNFSESNSFNFQLLVIYFI